MKKIPADCRGYKNGEDPRSSPAGAACNALCRSGQWPINRGFVYEIPRNPSLALLILIIIASFIFDGCSRTAKIQPEALEEFNLINRFMPINPGLPGTHFEKDRSVIRKGLRKDAIILMAPASVRASLKGISGRMILEGWATPVFNVGDGLQMDLFLRRAGARHLMGSRYFDAGRKIEDRDWIPIAFPLDLGQDDQLEIEVSAGPQGNLVADWLALSSLHLAQRKTTP